MRNMEEKKIEFIESLVETKTFTELSEGERLLVLEVIDAGEYESMRMLNQQLKSAKILQQVVVPAPDPAILTNIKKQYFSKKRTESGSWKSAFNWKLRIPAYQLGAAALIVIFLFVFVEKSPVYIEKPVLVENIVLDTVRMQSEKDTVFVDKYIVREVSSKPESPVDLDEKVKIIDAEGVVDAEEYLTLVSQNKGFSHEEKKYLLTLSIGNE